MSTWDEVGGDPCPGDVGALRSHVGALRQVSDHGHDVEGRLVDLHRGMGDLRWEGEGAAAVSKMVSEAVPPLAEFWTAYKGAADALSNYTDHLEDLQSEARAALNQYASATGDLSRAHNDSAGASQRYNSADGQIRHLDARILELQLQRRAAILIHQPTVSLDHETAGLQSQRSYQIGLRSAAATDRASADGRAAEADHRKQTARSKIDNLREELRGYARGAATTILASVGIVKSNNPLVRGWEDVVGGVVAGAKWAGDNSTMLLHSWDQVEAWVGVAALALQWVPVLGEILGVAFVVMASVSLVGHVYQLANGKESWTGTAEAVVYLNPFGKALGLMAKTSEVTRFDTVLGVLKRAHGGDLRTVTGPLRQIKLFGRVVYRPHAIPRLVKGPPVVYKTLMVLKAGELTYRDYKNVSDDLHDAQDALTGGRLAPVVKEVEAPIRTILFRAISSGDHRPAGVLS